jgi:hypothetical protein
MAEAFNLDHIEVDYKRDIHQWLMIDPETKELVCKCWPKTNKMVRKSAKSTLVSCDKCKLSADVEVLKLLYECKAFLDYPKIALPVCKICKACKIVAYASYDKEKRTRELTVACSCKPANYYRVSNGDSAVWNYTSSNGVRAAIDVEIAANLPIAGEQTTVAEYRDRF